MSGERWAEWAHNEGLWPMVWLSLTVSLCLGSVLASAQERPDTSLDIRQVRIRGARSRQIITPQELSGAELQRLNALSVADALRYFAGVQLKDYGGVGGLKTINVRSMGSQHVGVYYDGIQLGNAQNGQVDLGKYSLDNVESIMLYNGQKSDIFQSAKDFGHSGTVYITSRRPLFEGDRRMNLLATLRGGSFGLINPSVLLENRLTSTVSSSLNAEVITATGRYKFRYRRVTPDGRVAYDTTAMRENGDIHAVRVEGAVYGHLPHGSWQLRAYHYQSERGMPGAIVNNVWRREERLWDRNTFVQGSLRSEVTDWYKTQASAKFADDYTQYINYDTKLLQVDRTYSQKELYLSSAHLFTLTPWLDASASYDLQWNTLRTRDVRTRRTPHDFPFPSRYTQYGSAAVALQRWGVRVQLTALGTWVINRVQRYYKAPDKLLLTPGVFASYTPVEAWGLSLRAFYKRSMRLPTFNDLYYTDIGNAYLKPEYVTQYDVGLAWQHEWPQSFIQRADATVDAYYNEVRDKIVAYPRGQQFRWTMLNLGRVHIRGVDATAGATLCPHRDWAITLRLQYTWQRAQDVTNPQGSFYRHQIPYVPWHSGSAIVGVQYKMWSLNYSYIYVGERYNQSENIVYNHMQPWYTSDLALFGDFRWGDYRLRAGLEVNNALSQAYDVILNYPRPGRNYKLSLTFSM